MNTAVILNQSAVFQANEWRSGCHFPVSSSGYQMPVHTTLLPIAGLKQLPLEKTGNNWTNVPAIYPPQIPMVPFLGLPQVIASTKKPAISCSTSKQSHKVIQINQSSLSVPQFHTTSSSHSETIGIQGEKTSQAFSSVNKQPNTTIDQRQEQCIPSNNKSELKEKAGYAETKTIQGYSGNYMIQNLVAKPCKYISSEPPLNSSVNLMELSPYKESRNTESVERQNLLQTRKRSPSWPSGFRLSKKKAKDGVDKDDQIIEEYKKLEMDVARILISDIPFPVVSLGKKASRVERPFVSNSRDMRDTSVDNAVTLETKKGEHESASWSGVIQETPTQERISVVENERVKVPEEQEKRSDIWSGQTSGLNGQVQVSTRVVSGGEVEEKKQKKISEKFIMGNGELVEPQETRKSLNQLKGRIPEAREQTKVTSVGGGTMESRKKTNGLTNNLVEVTPVRNYVAQEFRKQENIPPLISGSVIDSKNMNQANKRENTSASSDVVVDHVKQSVKVSTEVQLHSENEKENDSKNLADPNKIVFTCQQCVVTFESICDLIAHKASHTSRNFTFKCNVCTQVFRSTSGLQKHIEFHADHHKHQQCSFCFKRFSDRDGLEEHIIGSHMSKRPHKCSYCPKAFRDPGSLQKHIRIHTGERPYKCTACEKSFAEYSSLRKHNRVHTGEQPYKCQYCPKAFSISGNLQRHILIHTGERPYKCSECSKTFNNPSHLRRHEKNLHSKLEREK